MNMHTSHTLTHIWIQVHKQTYNYTYIKTHLCQDTLACVNTHAYTRTHALMHTYSRTYIHICTHAQALTHTWARALTRTRAYKKMHSQTLRTYTHRYTHTLTHANQHASAHRIYRPTPKRTLVHSQSHIYMCSRTPIDNTHQHVRLNTDAQTYMHSVTHAYTYTLENVCVVRACVCM